MESLTVISGGILCFSLMLSNGIASPLISIPSEKNQTNLRLSCNDTLVIIAQPVTTDPTDIAAKIREHLPDEETDSSTHRHPQSNRKILNELGQISGEDLQNLIGTSYRTNNWHDYIKIRSEILALIERIRPAPNKENSTLFFLLESFYEATGDDGFNPEWVLHTMDD